ncbi:MAG: hypothetical protein U1F70_01370 [Candidatus Competibacteraceae bacterium]
MLLTFSTYTLPFIHIIPYIWFDYSDPPNRMWGLAVNPYMVDQTIIELMSIIGAVGAIGLIIGISYSSSKLANRSYKGVPNYKITGKIKTLPMPFFLAWTAIGIVASWLFAPEQTIFTAAYTESKSISSNWNFGSIWMISYAFLAFAFADSLFEISKNIRRLKKQIIIYSILFIVIWLQLLRGDRESLPFVLGCFLMHYIWNNRLTLLEKRKIPWKRILLWILVIFSISNIIGTLRSNVVGKDVFLIAVTLEESIKNNDEFKIDDLFSGTWSAALLSPLSISGDYVNNMLSIKYGKTYIDLLVSIMPGFIADWIGYIRPIDSWNGPAWEMRYGIGGTHAVVVPFINFKIIGVFLIIFIWSFALAKIEFKATKNPNVFNLSLLVIMTTALPHWLWYGEKNIINSLIIWLILSLLYRLCLSNKIRSYYQLIIN